MAAVYVVNPSRRKRRARRRGSAKRASRARTRTVRRRRKNRSQHVSGYYPNPGRRRRRRFSGYRRNPIGARGLIASTLIPAVIGAGGALATNIALNFLPLPVALKAGPAKPLIKAGIAVGLGMLVGKLVNRTTGASLAIGGVTVVAAQTLADFLQRQMPALPLGELMPYPVVEYQSNNNDMGALVDVDGMGALVHEPLGEYDDDDAGDLVALNGAGETGDYF